MGTRRQSRECALQLLYQLDLSGEPLESVFSNFWAVNSADEDVRLFTEDLVRGVILRRDEIDNLVAEHSTNWKLSRMASVDKNILRMATFEMMNFRDIPLKVTINEAVEVAKKYGTADSGAFVNGILDNIAKKYAKEVTDEQ